MHLAVDRQHMALPRHRRTDHEALERQPVHIDVEIGEQRRVGVARRRFQLGSPRQRDEVGAQRADVDMVVRIGEGPPVDVQPGAGQEHALGIADPQIDQAHPAVKRSLDPPDLDVQARGGGIAAQLVRDEAAARIGVDPQDDRPDQQDQAQDRDADPFEHPLPQRATHHHSLGRGRRLRRHALFVRHQNACPIEIYRATFPSPGRGFSGVATSTRSGPKLV